jgi:FkbM family methyltransferase
MRPRAKIIAAITMVGLLACMMPEMVKNTVAHKVSRMLDTWTSRHCPMDRKGRYEHCTVAADGVQRHVFIDPHDLVVSQPFRRGKYWESWMHAYFRRFANVNAAALDVGANLGAHTLVLSSLFAEVHSFEMQESVLQLLAKNVRANHVQQKVHMHPTALGRTVGAIGHYCKAVGAKNFGGVSASKSRAATGRGCKEVPLTFTTLDKELAGLRRPIALVKVDVEGFEEEVLLGARQLLERHRPVLMFESFKLSRLRNLTAMLSDLGYSTRLLRYPEDYIALPSKAP